VKRWNFRKADWKRFCHLTDESVERLPYLDTSNIERAYQDFCKSPLSAAKQCIPCGRWKNYVPCWDKECVTTSHSFTRAQVGTDFNRAASSLLSQLGQKQGRWEEAVNSIDFLHSSRKVWRTVNKLTGRFGRFFHQCPISANSIAPQLVKNGAEETRDCKSTRLVNKQLSDLWKIPTPEGHSISEPFRPKELAAVLRCPKPEKSPGLDSIFLEFKLPAGSALKPWFCDFLSSCTRQLKIPKIWRRALIVKAIGGPRVTVPYPCCVPFKILERLIYARVDSIIDSLLPREQAGFRHGRSTVDQFILLTQDIEDSFSADKKARAVFVDLSLPHCMAPWPHLQAAVIAA